MSHTVKLNLDGHLASEHRAPHGRRGVDVVASMPAY